MKKLIILSLLLVFILAIAVHSAVYIVDDFWWIQENADETYNDTGSTDSSSLYNDSAFTDGDYDTYTYANGTFYMNYTKKADYSGLSRWQVKYNASGGAADTVNHSLPSSCWGWNDTKLRLKVNTSANATKGNAPGNAHYCYSGTWDRIGDIQTEHAIYEEAMWWYVKGRNYSISHNPVVPAAYVTFDNTLVNFSLNINDSRADINHSTFNCSLYTRMSNTANYTLNVSDIVITNSTAHNGTTVTFADGSRVWWKWSCEDNYSRIIFNTSVRVFDVDLIYYTLSLGANKVINLSLDSGEIVTKGGITAANLTLTGSGKTILGDILFNVTKEIEINPTDFVLAGANVPERTTVSNYQTLAFMNGTTNDFMINLQLPPDYTNNTDIFVNILWAPNSSNSGNVSWCLNSTFITEDVNETINTTTIVDTCVYDENQLARYALHRTPDITINASGMTDEDTLGLRFWRNLTVLSLGDYQNGTYFVGANIKYTSYRLGS